MVCLIFASQRLMSIDIFDNDEVDGDPEDQVDSKYHNDFGTRITISKKVADIVHPRMLVSFLFIQYTSMLLILFSYLKSSH